MRNKHAGPCYHCGLTVEAGKGYFERYQNTWRVQHIACCNKARMEKFYGKPTSHPTPTGN